ncbi:MAG: radical SAM protein [bacterium]|nr:radical SAM protein [bacterium]
MTPYHLFEYRGVPFVYHRALGKFMSISRAAYDYLELRQTFSKDEVEAKFRARHPAAVDVLAEVGTLEANGFFQPVEAELCGDSEFEEALARRYSENWSRLELSLSERCNLACRYCYCGTCRDEVPNSGLMPSEIARRAVEWLFAHSGKDDVSITFFGGEPLLNKQVMKEAIALSQKLAAERGVKAEYVMTTNGTLLDDEAIDLIKTYNFGLMVSLDGPQELHDAQCPTRDGNGSWDLATAGIRRLMKRRSRVTVRCTMAHPVPDLMKLIRFFDGFGFTRIVLGPVSNPIFPSACDFTAEDRRQMERQTADEVVPWMLDEVASGREPKYNPFSDLEEDQVCARAPGVSPFRCGACRGTTTVGADGTLYPCHRFVGMKDWVVGTMAEGPDLDRCRAFWRNWRACVKETCSKCWAYRICGGPCPWAVAREDGTFRMDPSYCDEVLGNIRQGAWYLDLKRRQQTNKGEVT